VVGTSNLTFFGKKTYICYETGARTSAARAPLQTITKQVRSKLSKLLGNSFSSSQVEIFCAIFNFSLLHRWRTCRGYFGAASEGLIRSFVWC